MMQTFWANLYAGAPDYNASDAGTNFNSTKFKGHAASMVWIVRIVPTAVHGGIGIIEGSHGYLRTVYEKPCISLPHFQREEQLSMSLKHVNDALSSKTEISPTTLVFGVYPKIPGGGPRSTILRRPNIIQKAQTWLSKQNRVIYFKTPERHSICPVLTNSKSCKTATWQQGAYIPKKTGMEAIRTFTH